MLVNFGYKFIETYVDMLSQAKPEDVVKAASKYFTSRKYLAMATIPESTEDK